MQIEDLQGCQVSDFLAFHRDRPGLGISTTVTRALVDGLFPLPGQGIYDGEGDKLLTLVEDTVGRHDTFGIACNREYYESLGHPDHINCTDNFNRELAAFGYEPRRFWEPINFFYNTKIGADGRVIDIEPALSKAGRLRAHAGGDGSRRRILGVPRRPQPDERLRPDGHHGAGLSGGLVGLPAELDHVAVRVTALDADVIRLVPEFDDLDAVGGEALSECPYLLGRLRSAEAEVEEARQLDRLVGLAQGEANVAGAVDQEHAVVRDPRGRRIEAEVRLVEPPRTGLVAHRERDVRH